jgi:undecaprenyl-diphosphatase
MHMLWFAVVLGVVEGLTEFLPISSTGHLILTSHLLGFGGRKAEVFEVFIQLGAILAVAWEYRKRLWRAAADLRARPAARGLAAALALAFLPAAILGLLVHGWIAERLFRPATVAAAMIGGALLILLVEALPLRPRTREPESVSAAQALGIGLAQCVSLWPGFSRSAATILGGLLAGLDRRAATEFSFFLAVPTMVAASGYDLVKNRDALGLGDAGFLALAFVVSFAVAWGSIRWFLRYVSTHTLRPFAWYRLILGLLVLLLVRA